MTREDFEREVIDRLARIEQKQSDQLPRCESHAAEIRALKARTVSLEDSRTFIKGMAAMAAKISLAATGISGIVYGWIHAFGSQSGRH